MIRLAIVGLGNCASSLLQAISADKINQLKNLITPVISGYNPRDIEIVACFDIDERKVGLPVNIAYKSLPNCTTIFHEIPSSDFQINVKQGYRLDGAAKHCSYDFDPIHAENNENPEFSFLVLPDRDPTWDDAKNRIVRELKTTTAKLVVSYLPVGSKDASRFYAECALDAGCGYINAMPEFLTKTFANEFKKANLPLLGDDIKSQVGATILHRELVNLFERRGMKIKKSYQLNVGGNMDFRNMLARERLESKKISKTQAVTSLLPNFDVGSRDMHVGPSDYVGWLNDNKICFLRIEAEHLGGVPMSLELRLSVEDSPNSAGVMLDVIRLAQTCLDRKYVGVVPEFCGYYFKSPPIQWTDEKAENKVRFLLDNPDSRIIDFKYNARGK